MPRHRLTVRFLDSIKPPTEGRVDYWDTTLPGFGLRASSAGGKAWMIMYRQGGVQRRHTFGQYPTLTLADAREIAGDKLREVAKGGDPSIEKKAQREALTFKKLGQDYVERHAKQRKRSWKKDQMALERDLNPAFGAKKARDVTPDEIDELLDKIKKRGAPIQANRTFEILRKIFNWAISKRFIEVNPCQGIEKPAVENRRERVLSDNEIRSVWAALDEETQRMGAMFRMRLITAQRGGEISRMRWKDIDGGWWTIPAEFSKNNRSHRVPLSRLAKEILDDIRPPAGVDTEGEEAPIWVFPSPSGRGPITSIWKAVKRIRDRSKVDFVPHDLRRTAASRMTGDLGIGRLTVSKILNHVETGVTSVYDRHSYDAEKRQALEAWGRRLNSILDATDENPKVVRIG